MNRITLSSRPPNHFVHCRPKHGYPTIALLVGIVTIVVHQAADWVFIYVTDGMMGRTTSAPISALRLIVDKDQGLRSGILSESIRVISWQELLVIASCFAQTSRACKGRSFIFRSPRRINW